MGIGLSLTPCTLPGRAQPSFTLDSDEMILGLGIHGEAGVKRMPLGSAAVAVKTDLEAFEAATCAAEKGASDTLGLKAKAGRASYVDAKELKHPDPGAHAVGIIMRALYQGYKLVNPAI